MQGLFVLQCSSVSSLGSSTAQHLYLHPPNYPQHPCLASSEFITNLKLVNNTKKEKEKIRLIILKCFFYLVFHHRISNSFQLCYHILHKCSIFNSYIKVSSRLTKIYAFQIMFPIEGDILLLIFSLLYFFLHIVLTLNFSHFHFSYLFPTTVLIWGHRTIRSILGIIPQSLLIFISKWDICHALCKFWRELSVWRCLCHWFD